MKEFINKYKREVIMSVVVSLITTGIIKVWDWFVLVAPAYGKTIIGTIDNLTYVMAASQSSTSLVRTLISWLLGVVLGIAFIMLGECVSDMRTYAKFDNLYNQLKNGSKEDVKKILSEIEDKHSMEPSTEKTNKSQKQLLKLGLGFMLSVLLMYASCDVLVLRPSTLWTRFEKDITMIAPYVDEHELIQKKSEWVCMREKQDYIEIYEYIDAVKEKYALPKH